jgi:prepilin-type N-terminal cleavage/methylation domain-containing protein
MTTTARRRLRLQPVDDQGVTLIELVVTLSIMSILMSIFTVGVVQMFRSANRTESTASAQSQITLAFLRLDREIRYAAGVSAPGRVSSDWYVEYVTTNTGASLCTQLRLTDSTDQLQRRTWSQGNLAATATAWLPLVSNISQSPSGAPFVLLAAAPPIYYQRLRVAVQATAGSGDNATAPLLDITINALNSTPGTNSATVCQEGRPTS